MEINIKYDFQMPICGIYQITCKVNNKIYIGQSKNVVVRIMEHLRNFIEQKNDSAIQYDYDRWGIDAFEWEILEKCNLVDLRELEKAYIAKYFGTTRLYNQVIDRPYPDWFLQGKESP